MAGYLPAAAAERAAQYAALGLSGPEALYRDVPESVRLTAPLNLPPPQSELEVRRTLEALAEQNLRFRTILRGAGAYDHYIPAAVSRIASKEEFVTAYTPYQAEISQGVLQSIFEFQTMICELTGLDAANASVYDGASAAAEAVAMCRERKRTRAVVSAAAHPDVISTIRTYSFGAGTEVAAAPAENGVTDLTGLLDETTACVYVQQPNFFGQLEDLPALAAQVHAAGARLIVGVNPAALGVLESPGACGADIAVGEGQPLGLPLSWGGPYLGFMAASQSLMRRLPGRIVGETRDSQGERALSSPCRPGSSTSAGRRPRPTCALTRRCAPSPPPSTCPSWGRTGFGRWASSATLRPTTWPQSCAGCPACPCATPAPSSTSLSPICPNPRRCFPPWRRAASWGAGRWRAGCCGAPRRSRAAPSWTRPCPLSRRCWTDEADF